MTTDEPRFRLGQRVEKYTGDYGAEGEVRAVYTTHAGGPTRYMVALDRITRGRIMHTLADGQLRTAAPAEASAVRHRKPTPLAGLWRLALVFLFFALMFAAIVMLLPWRPR